MKSIRMALCIAIMAMPPVAIGQSAAAVSPTAVDRRVHCPWVTSMAPIPERVGQLLGRMTLDQKIHEVHGVSGSPYVGEIPAIPSLCIPALTMQDGPGGVGDGMTDVTQLPAPVALAATWDTELAGRYGAVIGSEQRGKGVNVDLGPTLNIVRDPRWGRAFEAYGEDPYLTGQIGIAYVRGVQGTGTLAQIKHLVAYNQETHRNKPADNVIIDERTLQEMYLRQFATVIGHADPASIMCSYSYINGVAACEDHYTLKQVLRKQFGYRGFVTSDWGGTHSTVASAEAGMNVEMPDGKYYGAALKRAVKSGAVSVATIDGLLRPLLAEMFRFHLFDDVSTGSPDAVVTTPTHVAIARTVAEQGAVLLKNAEHVLPLSAGRVHSIAVIGADAGADAVTVGGGSASVDAASIVTPYQGIEARAGRRFRVRYAQGNLLRGELPLVPGKNLQPSAGAGHGLTGRYYKGVKLSGSPVATRDTQTIAFDWKGTSPVSGLPASQWSAKWTGKLSPPVTGRYVFSLACDGTGELLVDGKTIIVKWHRGNPTKSGTIPLVAGHPVSIEVAYGDNGKQGNGSSLRLGWLIPGGTARAQQALLRQAADVAASSDVAVVFASDFESEGTDLADIDLSADQDRLISTVAAANPDTIVVLNTGSAVSMPWLDSVKGVIEAWYPGQADGSAIAALLFGDVNPSGKLPVTFPESLADVPASTPGQWPGVHGRVSYSEGLDVGYRWYDAKGIRPLFAFGYGLSYTTFAVNHLRVTPRSATPGGIVRATVDVTNTGRRSGTDVVQLYVGDPADTGEPPKQLRGFQRISLEPGQTVPVSFSVQVRDFAIWDSATHGWRTADGIYQVMVGDSSAHLPQRAAVRVVHVHGHAVRS
ncbi:MAG: glycoside hydrolase family 3 C-terminal domain-containing protein [Rhodanobacteraceae bacterium]